MLSMLVDIQLETPACIVLSQHSTMQGLKISTGSVEISFKFNRLSNVGSIDVEAFAHGSQPILGLAIPLRVRSMLCRQQFASTRLNYRPHIVRLLAIFARHWVKYCDKSFDFYLI